MTTFRIQIATPTELETVAGLFDLYRQFYEQPGNLALARIFIGDRIRNDESVILLAWDEQHKATGFCQLYPSFCSIEAAPIYLLSDLFVVPEARRSGVGKALLEAAGELAARNGRRAWISRPPERTSRRNRSTRHWGGCAMKFSTPTAATSRSSASSESALLC